MAQYFSRLSCGSEDDLSDSDDFALGASGGYDRRSYGLMGGQNPTMAYDDASHMSQRPGMSLNSLDSAGSVLSMSGMSGNDPRQGSNPFVNSPAPSIARYGVFSNSQEPAMSPRSYTNDEPLGRSLFAHLEAPRTAQASASSSNASADGFEYGRMASNASKNWTPCHGSTRASPPMKRAVADMPLPSSKPASQPKLAEPTPASVPGLRARWSPFDFRAVYDTAGYPGHVDPAALNDERERNAWGWVQEQLDLRAADIEQQGSRRLRGADFINVGPLPETALAFLPLYRGMWDIYLAQEARRKAVLGDTPPGDKDIAANLAGLSISGGASPKTSAQGDRNRLSQQPKSGTNPTATYASAAVSAQSGSVSGEGFTTVQSKSVIQRTKKDAQMNASRRARRTNNPAHPTEVEEDFSRWYALPQGKMPPKHMEYNCGVRRSGRLDFTKYNGTARMDLNLCAYHFSDDPHVKCRKGAADCFWRHWSIEAGPDGKENWVDQAWLGRIKAKKGYKHEYPPDHFSCRKQYAGIPRYYNNGDVILPGGTIVSHDDYGSLSERHKMVLDYQTA
ncbi:hypothetical protein J4E86_006913 [Alternaria arbusti]|uniref:uncharacterized protein n=1 Tax=Alternaria arbusti TaxID=232088 RepID=UPI002221195F|nr:uncharacterized protein J4E86_006913 [Alternaria arbusti]KAI4953370.1 hypothetical protein J4E86_006913 [Alternaria arbusti]